MKLNKSIIYAACGTLAAVILFSHCSGTRAQVKTLPSSDQEFLSSVRYLITKKEKREFSKLTDEAERKAFIREFWLKRDPDPDTEVNEFKEVYFERIDTANRLFGRNGWISDRGRVLILLGPPETKRVFPTGMSTSRYSTEPSIYELPLEIWYYGYYSYPIVFVDRLRSNSYELSPLSAQHVATISRAGMILTPHVDAAKKPADFSLKIIKGKSNQTQVHLEIPYKNIIFQEIGKRYEAVLQVNIKITDPKGDQVYQEEKEYKVSLTPDDLQTTENNYKIEVSLKLDSGDYEIEVTVGNKSDESKLTKKTKFKI